ncbi:EcsC family protein [Hasllibacter halocynthiae]|uniref:EcsC family protein n=1 Tax=Hasllibacter halocynthiae TaxID=595589 RepID=A0A2T0X6B2_9RHOB|nr:EcsC family protein [Hasllibacter halocynthiae]PRY94425.1 EcsC family protein [Hasllibacter halocynthiae]
MPDAATEAAAPEPNGTDHPADQPFAPHVEAEIAQLAQVHRDAAGAGMSLLSSLGAQAEGLLDRLPAAVRGQLNGATRQALQLAYSGASMTRGGRLPDTGERMTTALSTAMGAAGGFGGLPTALAEVPVTTAFLMRAMQGIAAEHGFDPADEQTRLACVQTFAAAGPLAGDDGGTAAFLTLRFGTTGAGLKAVIGQVVPVFSLVLGRKVAAQAVPVLGGALGAAVNWTYTSYYQDMARVQFGLMKLARDEGLDPEAVIARFRDVVQPQT